MQAKYLRDACFLASRGQIPEEIVVVVVKVSQRTGGSILGDKTRMQRISRHPNAFVRPSPNQGTLGGIARRTREAMLLCEAAGFDVIFVETVGVGQAEFSVHLMVDMLLLLLITGAGDDLQGIKRGIMEMADLIVVNKADGENALPAQRLVKLIQQATHVLPDPRDDWSTAVLSVSSIEHAGFEQVATALSTFEMTMRDSGALDVTRRQQAVAWMHQHIDEQLLAQRNGHDVLLNEMENAVSAGKLTPMEAARAVLAQILKR
ncbi:MAG: methylmalonyl Co-A mutase-associated GTPase MeaB [Bacteroidota bacterium]